MNDSEKRWKYEPFALGFTRRGAVWVGLGMIYAGGALLALSAVLG